MNRADALKKLKPILGANLAYREDPNALTGESLEQAGEFAKIAGQEYRSLDEQVKARRQVVLAADVEYQALVNRRNEAEKRRDAFGSRSRRRRIVVGYTKHLEGLGTMFHQKAEGDNWQDVVDQLTRAKV